MPTFNELCEIAKQRKVKHYRQYKKHDLEKILSEPFTKEFYEKYCKGKWRVKPVLVKNSNGEVKNFKSLYATGKYFNVFPQTIKWRILYKKPLLDDNGITWSFEYK